jgi:arylsulfatase A
LDFITEHQSEPFFVYYPMALVHNPFKDGTPDALTPATNKEGFLDMVNYMDKLIGRILDKLDELGLRNDTLVMFSGDNGTNTGITSLFNGENYKGGKGTTPDNGTHVPFAATWPGHIPEGSVSDDLADYSDFVSTIADVAGVPLPQDINFDGRSLRSQLLGRSRDPRRWVYCFYMRNAGNNPKILVRNKQWKLYQEGGGDSARSGNLYDVINDFGESNPVTPDPGSELENLRNEFQAVLDRMDADSN